MQSIKYTPAVVHIHCFFPENSFMKIVFKTDTVELQEGNTDNRANSEILNMYAVNVIYVVLFQCIHTVFHTFIIEMMNKWTEQRAWINWG